MESSNQIAVKLRKKVGSPEIRTRDDFQHAARMFRAGRMSLTDFTNQCFTDIAKAAAAIADLDAPQARVCLDVDRPLRCGFPEVVYGAGKSPSAIREAIEGLLRHGQPVLVTRVEDGTAAALQAAFPESHYNADARTFRIGRCATLSRAKVAVVTAGTSDFCVAAEACQTLYWMGIDADLIQDVGVAGPQRLQAQLPRLKGCDAVVAIAGFEGALPSVVGGHLDCPVIAVPTSTGAGIGWPGLAPLLAMLNSCAPNVAVVNVDSGFKAGYLAGLIARSAARQSAEIPSSECGQLR